MQHTKSSRRSKPNSTRRRKASATSKMMGSPRRIGAGTWGYIRVALAIAAAVVLTFFAMQIYYLPKIALVYKIVVIVVIAVVGVAGVAAMLSPDGDEDGPPVERLYTADEVAALLAAVQAGRLVPAAAEECKFCHGAEPDATGVDGSRYHTACFQSAF